MVRILHFVSSIGIGNGIANFIMNYYRNMPRDVVQFDFMYFDKQEIEFKDEILSLGGRLILMERPTSLSAIKKYFNFFKEHAHEYTALHNHEPYINILLAGLAKKYKIKNVIVHSHVTKYSDRFLRSIRNGIMCKFAKLNTDYYMACSKSAAKFMFGSRFTDNDKVIIINNAIDYKKYIKDLKVGETYRKKLNISGDTFVVGNVGRLSPQKNHNLILDIFNEIAKKRSNSALVLVGDGYLLNDLKKKAASLGLSEKIIFLGERKDVNMIYQMFNIFLFPSIYEGLGIAAIEAQVAGIPCFVSSNVPKEAYITDYIFEIDIKKSPDLLAEYILDIYDNISKSNLISTSIQMDYDICLQANKLLDFYSHI